MSTNIIAMKRIIIILICFFTSIVTYSQTPFVNTPTTGSVTTLNRFLGGISSDSLIRIAPTYTDTTVANFSKSSIYIGSLIRIGQAIWYRGTTHTLPNKWFELTNTTTGLVSSVTGTANQISASPTIGDVILTLPSSIITPGSLSVTTNQTIGGNLTITGSVSANSLSAVTGRFTGDVRVGAIVAGEWNASNIGVAYGGTNISSYATGDMIFASAANVLSRRTIGADGQSLLISAGVPVWGTYPNLTPGYGLAGSAYNGQAARTFTVDTSIIATKSELSDSVAANKLKIWTWGDSFTSPGVWQDYLTGWLGYTYYNGGVAGEDAPAVLTRFLAHPESYESPTTIWVGRNGFPDSATVIADITRMVDTLRAHNNTRFYIVSILMPSTAPIGTGDHTLILAINRRLQDLFPDNFINLNTFLISKYNPSIPQDVTDYANQVTPSSLRLTGDNTHLNDTGYYWTAYRFDQSLPTLLGNPTQYFQNTTSGYLQATSLNRNALANGVEIGYDSTAKIGYIGVRTNDDDTQRPLVIQNGTADVSILPGGGANLNIGATTTIITGNTTVSGNLTNTGILNTGRAFVSAMPVYVAGTPLFTMYNATDGGELQRATVAEVKTILSLSDYLLKTDTASMLSGYTRLPRFLDTATAIQARIQTKQPLLTNPVTGTGISGYLSRWTGTTTQDTSIVLSSGGRIIIGENATPGSGFDIENAINGLPASSGSAPRGGLRISNSNNIALDFFNVSSGLAGLQVSDKGNYATNFPFSLQPNGAPVLIGTSTNNGVDKLQVNGTINATANTYSSGGYAALVRNTSTGAFEKTNMSGTVYTPTISNTTNVASSSIPRNATYTVIDNIVTVYFYAEITPTAPVTLTNFRITLPVTTAVTTQNYVGAGIVWTGSSWAAGIATGTTCDITFTSTGTSAVQVVGSFQYQIN
jgi:lysophospholipase L1-like esterase